MIDKYNKISSSLLYSASAFFLKSIRDLEFLFSTLQQLNVVMAWKKKERCAVFVRQKGMLRSVLALVSQRCTCERLESFSDM